MSVTDIAHCILKSRGKALHFKELITEVMRVKGINQENPGRLIAQMHTEINLDSRFNHQGNGEWSLREWQKGAKVVKIRPEAPAAPARSRSRGVLRDDEDDEEALDSEEEDEFEAEEAEDEYETDSDEYDDEED